MGISPYTYFSVKNSKSICTFRLVIIIAAGKMQIIYIDSS